MTKEQLIFTLGRIDRHPSLRPSVKNVLALEAYCAWIRSSSRRAGLAPRSLNVLFRALRSCTLSDDYADKPLHHTEQYNQIKHDLEKVKDGTTTKESIPRLERKIDELEDMAIN